MKTIVNSLTLPDSPSDYTVLPFATPRIEPGNYLSLAFGGEAGWTMVECVIEVEPI